MITFKGTHASAYSLGAKVTSWSMVPASSDSYIDIPGRHGSYHFPGKRRDLLIGVEFAFVGNSQADMYAKSLDIKAWLYSEERDTILFDFLSGKHFIGKPDGEIDMEPFFVLGKFEVSFRCEPFAYGEEVTENFTADAATVTNTGTYEALPVFNATFTATASEWKVTLGTKYVRIVHDFQIGDTLDVNCVTGATLINGSRALDKYDWQNSEFFALPVGESTMTILPAGVCTAEISFVPRWV